MDLKIIGAFIASQRKAAGLTQAKLAEKLNISEKTVSKWECGNGFVDTTLMLPLCKELGITANELLSGKKLADSEYKQSAEQNLIALKDAQQKATKQLLDIEIVLGYTAVISFFIMVFTAGYFVQNTAVQIVLICIGLLNVFVAIIFCLKIEREAGYYMCASCGHKYIPSYKAVFWAAHIGRTRHLKCPHCGKRTWNKKVIDQD